MKRFAMAVAALLLLLPGAAVAAKAGLEKYSLAHDGMTRTYWLHDPRGGAHGGKRPLVIVIHGGGGEAEKFDVMTGADHSFDALADREDILVAYPQGYKKQWNDGREVANIEAQAQDLDDVGFISALIDEMVKTRDVDPKRVYATGPSNGGHMSNRLACDLADKVAAVGIVIANMPAKMEKKCHPAKPVSVLIMNGTADPLVPYNGGEVRLFHGAPARGTDISTEDTFSFWLRQAGCRAEASSLPVKALPHLHRNDPTRVSLRACAGDRAHVALYTVDGGGHTWPGGRQYLFQFMVGRVNRDIDATAVIWDFFRNSPPR